MSANAKQPGAKSIGVFLTALVILFIAVSVHAKTDKFDIQFKLSSGYNDNILGYSDADLDQINDSSNAENQYGIESEDDYIINPQLSVVYKTHLAGHSFHLGGIFDYYYYQENDIKNYFRVETYFRNYFRKDLYFQGSVAYVPDYYYRNCYVTGDGYYEAKFDKISLEAQIAVPLLKYAEGNIFYRYSNKDFIDIFDERDINAHEIEGELAYRPVKFWKGWGAYAFTTAKAAGADNDDYRRDTSYDSNTFTFGSRFYLNGIKHKSFQLTGKVAYSIVYYQTEKITSEDRYRLGREDYRWSLSFMLDHEITNAFNLGLRYNWTDKNVDLPAEDLKQYLESNANSIYLILEYSL